MAATVRRHDHARARAGADLTLRGGYLQRLRERGRSLHRPAKIAYALLFTVVPGLLAYLAFFAAGEGDTQDPTGVEAREAATSTTTSAPTPPTSPPVDDPYLYANFEGVHPRRSQECDGLLGLCMGQPIDQAMAIFGDEVPDFPQAVQPSEYTVATRCHRWSPPRFEAVTVCEADGAIVSVELTFSSEATFALALPHDLVVRFPDALATAAEVIAEGLGGDEPFQSSFIQAEGEDVAAFDWYLPLLGEGPPDAVLSIDGRRGWADTTEFDVLTPCRPQGVSYRYEDVAAATMDMLVETVRVARTAPTDLGEPECG